MTSQINPNNIDGTYPVAGVPNNTQGMRDNFTNTRTNFQYASDEITELQNKSVLKAAITGTTLDNNMNDQEIYAVQLRDVSYAYSALTATAGSINIDYSVAIFQQINLSGPISLSFSNWPTAGTAGAVQVGFNITNVSQTVTLPAAVTQGVTTIAGISPGTPGVSNTITFGTTGNFAFEFITVDGGTNVWVFDNSRAQGNIANPLSITANTASTSDTTGALTVTGGVGILGNLNIGGNLVTYTSAGNVAFEAGDNGLITINAPTVPANSSGALNIVGSADGSYQPVYNTGSMVHVTGNDGVSNRITLDTFGTGAAVQTSVVLRLARGTAAAPTAVQSGDILGRITGSGFGNASQYVLAAGNIGTLGIDFVSLENYTTANAGSAMKFYTSPIGAVTKTLSANVTANVTTFPGNVAAANVVVSGTGGVFLTDGGTVGYGAGAGGTQSQSGNKSGGVTLNKPSGEITMQNTALNAATIVSFVLTNSTIASTDVMIINHVSGGTIGAYTITASCNNGSATIYVRNSTAGSLSESLVLRFAVIKGAIT
jgi:hypothetical protein